MNDADAASVNAWISVIRRARLGSTTTLVAFALASYAGCDGSRAYPGVARIAYQCELGYSTVRRALQRLRDVGLIEIVERGTRRTGGADVYRLVLTERVADQLHVPSPDEERLSIDKITDRERNHRSLASGITTGTRGPPRR